MNQNASQNQAITLLSDRLGADSTVVKILESNPYFAAVSEGTEMREIKY